MIENLSESYSAIYRNEMVEFERCHIRWPKHREEALIKWAGSGNRLLEIGFGKGTVLYNLHERFDQLFGVELSSLRVQKAQNAFKKTGIINVHLSTGNVEGGLPFEDRYFDCIIWADVIEHVIDLWTAMEEVRRLLRPKGRLITITPNIAKLRRRLMLMMGTFPPTSAKKGFGSWFYQKPLSSGHCPLLIRDRQLPFRYSAKGCRNESFRIASSTSAGENP